MKLKYRAWTEDEIERLRGFAAQGASLVRAAAAFNRTTNSVRYQARKLGLSFPHKFSYREIMRSRDIDNPARGTRVWNRR